MNVRIYQINMKRDTNNVAFMNYESLGAGIISFMINAPLSKEKGYRDVAKQGKETEV